MIWSKYFPTHVPDIMLDVRQIVITILCIWEFTALYRGDRNVNKKKSQYKPNKSPHWRRNILYALHLAFPPFNYQGRTFLMQSSYPVFILLLCCKNLVKHINSKIPKKYIVILKCNYRYCDIITLKAEIEFYF